MSSPALDAALDRLRLLAAPPEITWDILTGDCRAMLPSLRGGSIQTIVTSPPYYLKRRYDVPDTVWDDDPQHEHSWQPFTRKGVTGGANTPKLTIKDSENFQIIPDSEQAVCVDEHEHAWELRRRYVAQGGAASTHEEAFSQPGPSNAARIKAARWICDAACTLCHAWRGQLGLEPTPNNYIRHLVQVFEIAKRVLTDDGTVWVVIDDTYAGSGRGPSGKGSVVGTQESRQGGVWNQPYVPPGLKAKDMMGIPYRLAQAMQQAGWYWRSDIIWVKNTIPGSYTDRPTHMYEHVLLFSKSKSYFYNDVLENANDGGVRRIRDVWIIAKEPTQFKHFAVYPKALARRCIELGSRVGDSVLDTFGGIGRTGEAALESGRSFVGCELGHDYAAESCRRLEDWNATE